MNGSEKRLHPDIENALGYAERVRSLIDPDRGAAGLGVTRALYDALVAPGSRVRRRAVSMVAERLHLGLAPNQLRRLRLPLPPSRDHVLQAGLMIGLTVGIAAHGGVMKRDETQQLVERFGADRVKTAIGRRSLGSVVESQLDWPLDVEAVTDFGCRLLVAWAEDASPALAGLIETALPPHVAAEPLSVPAGFAAIDRLMMSVIDEIWRASPPAPAEDDAEELSEAEPVAPTAPQEPAA